MKKAITNKFTHHTIPITDCVAVNSGMAYCTNLDASLSFPCPLDAGVYSKEEIQLGFRVKDMGFNADDLPLIKIGAVTGDTFAVSVKDLEWISRAMSTESTRYYLNGVYFDKGAMVATDGHRLFKCKVEGANGNLIMPALTVKGVIDVAKSVGVSTVGIMPHATGMFIAIGKCEVVTKAIDGTYPDYMRVVPNHDAMTRFDIKSVNKAAKIVPMVNAASGSPSLHCKIGDGAIQAVSSDAWSIATDFTAEPRGFNVKYLKSVGMDGQCFIGGPHEPIKIINENRMAVVMPVRI